MITAVNSFEEAKLVYMSNKTSQGSAFDPLAIRFTVIPQPHIDFMDEVKSESPAMTLLELACYWGLDTEVAEIIPALTQAEIAYYQTRLTSLIDSVNRSVCLNKLALVGLLQQTSIGQAPETPPLTPLSGDETGISVIQITPPRQSSKNAARLSSSLLYDRPPLQQFGLWGDGIEQPLKKQKDANASSNSLGCHNPTH